MSSESQALPELTEPYPISAELAERYRRDGHILLRALAEPDEVAAYGRVIADYVERNNPQRAPLAERDTYHKAFLQLGNLWEFDAAVARFTLARRFAQVAADLMGVTGVRLYHDQALFKEPGGGPTPWHQDQYYWPLDTNQTVTMWMPLVDVPVEMGALTFATGSHRDGDLVKLAISDESEEALRRIVETRGFPIAQSAMRAGDATFHSGWTLHTAPGNQGEAMRAVMTVIYFADGSRISEPDNAHRPADLERWFPGQKPGEVAASRLNPLLYHREQDSN